MNTDQIILLYSFIGLLSGGITFIWASMTWKDAETETGEICCLSLCNVAFWPIFLFVTINIFFYDLFSNISLRLAKKAKEERESDENFI